ncbi:MAG: GGDEF domain-containing protein [Porticoccaceae bacterium]
MYLDVLTMSTMITVMSLTMAGSLLWLARGSNRSGLKLCATGLLLYGLSLPVLSLRGVLLSHALSIVAGNLMVCSSLAILVLAMCRFHDLKPNPWWILAPMIILLPGLLIMLDSMRERVIFTSLVFAAQHAALGWVALQHRTHLSGDGHVMAAAVTLISAVVLLVRALLEFTGFVSSPSFMAPELKYNYFLLSSTVAVLVFTLGFIFMARDAVGEDYRQLSIRDDLTGIANRRHLLQQIDMRLAEAKRTQTPLSLLMIDLDHFKDINDKFGHLAGDAALKEVAHIIKSRIRLNDLVGRYGGEEFAVLLPHTSPQAAATLAEDLRHAVENATIHYGGVRLNVTVSIGVRASLPSAPLSRDALIEGADQAMYRAKTQGRNQSATLREKLQRTLA